jgi:aminoglycoside phosphotransferase (APT) family kinase protein
MMYRVKPLVIAGLLGVDIAAPNIPSEAEYVAAYCRRTRREEIKNLDFYIAFNMFRFAAIIHGIKGRSIRGTAASVNAKDMIAVLPVFAQGAWKLAQGC